MALPYWLIVREASVTLALYYTRCPWRQRRRRMCRRRDGSQFCAAALWQWLARRPLSGALVGITPTILDVLRLVKALGLTSHSARHGLTLYVERRGSSGLPTAVCAVGGRGAALLAASRWVIAPDRCSSDDML